MSNTIIKYCGNCRKNSTFTKNESWQCYMISGCTKDSCDISNDLKHWQWDGKNMGPRLQLEAINGK